MRYPAAYALLLALALGLSSCVREADVPTEPNPVPVLPQDPGSAGKLTIEGVDSDGDGLRDDVQIHICTTYTQTATRAASIQLATAFQCLLVTGTEKPAARTAAASMNRAIDCLYSLDGENFGNTVENVEGSVVNTEARTRAYAKAGSFLSGGTYSVSTVANNAASCGEEP
jgi:hypothetical protein